MYGTVVSEYLSMVIVCVLHEYMSMIYGSCVCMHQRRETLTPKIVKYTHVTDYDNDSQNVCMNEVGVAE
jgi:hypothetical protein